jgi:hypothetical protein
LLPLPQLDEISALADWRSELDAQLPQSEKKGLVNSLLLAADGGADAVEEEFAQRLRGEIAPALQEDHEDQE